MKKNYKVIYNFNMESEETEYFDILNEKKYEKMENSENYILYIYNEVLGCYMALKWKLNEAAYNTDRTKEYCLK